MTLEKAEGILRLIDETILKELRDDLFRSAIEYARIRTNFYSLSLEEKAKLSSNRTRAHESLIRSCNILSRNMTQSGENTSWREFMGNDRMEIGDFACHLHCIFGLRER